MDRSEDEPRNQLHSKQPAEDSKDRPKNSPVPNYSEKYRDLMAKAALNVKPPSEDKPSVSPEKP